MTPSFPVPAAVLLLTFSSLLSPSTSQSSGDLDFPNCHRTFACGSLQNITYPFTGGDRPHHCGPPQFRLTCNEDDAPELSIDSVPYRVLHINQTQNTLTLARLDLWNNTCPEIFVNSTLDPEIFRHQFGNEDLTLVYGCSEIQNYTFYNLFSCGVSGVNLSDAYYVLGAIPVDPIMRVITTCLVSMTVPMIGDAARRLSGNETTLEEALTEGFVVNYADPFAQQCSNCSWAGDGCGFDDNSGKPVCICGNRSCPIPNITLSGGSKGPNSGIKIALPISGAVLAGVGLGWLIFALRQRRKRATAKSAQLTQAESKNLSSPSLSRGLTTNPSSQFFRSTPSLVSSKSELGKMSTYFGTQIFSYTELEEATDNFNPDRELGDGGFGIVYYGTLQDGRVVAVKRLFENNFKRVEQFMNEIEILTRLHHQHLVNLYGCTSKRSRELLLVYEYIPNGTVADHLHGRQSSSGLLSWPIRLNIAIETADALAYLHASDIIHRDVKTNNILLEKDFRVKVADFGLSRLFPTDCTHVSTAPQGTPGYVDPEYYQCYQLTEKSDVYSFGVVLVELISSKQAVDTNRDRQDINLANMAISRIQNHALRDLVDPSLGFETNSLVTKMVTKVAELAFRCLQSESALRPSMNDILTALRGIESQLLNVQEAEVVDIVIDDDAGLTKGNYSPKSADSSVNDKWGFTNSA